MAKYYKVFLLSCNHTWQNRKALFGLCLFLVLCLVIFANLWQLIAAKGGLTNMNPRELLWYIGLNQWVLIAIPRTERVIEGDLRSGKLAYLIPRPMSYLGYVFAEACGELFINLIVLGGVTYLFTWLFAGAITVSGWGLLVVLISGVLAGVIGMLFKMAMGLLAFWMHDVDPVAWIWEKLTFALGGLLLPLTAYPTSWQIFAKYTPFPMILGGRSALAIDYSSTLALTILISLLFWIAFGSALMAILYKKGLKILNVEGG